MSYQDKVTVALNAPKITTEVVNISDTTTPASTVNFVGPQGPAGPAGPALIFSGQAENRVLTSHASGTSSVTAEAGFIVDDSGDVFIQNDLTVSGNLNVSGDFTLGDSSTDSITTRGDLFVEDDAFFADAVHITGNLTVDGTASAANPTQNGHLTTKSYVDSADSSITTNLATSGTNLQTEIRNTGQSLKTDISSISGNVVHTTGAQTNIQGNKTFANDVNVLGNLSVSGNFTLGDETTDKITTRGDLYVDDDAFFGDDVTVTGNLNTRNIYPSVSGAHDIGSQSLKYNNIYAKTGNFDGSTINLGLDGARITTSADGDINLIGEDGEVAEGLKENPSIKGNLYIQSGMYVTGLASIGGNLQVSGDFAVDSAPTQNSHVANKLYVDSVNSTTNSSLNTTGSVLHRDIHLVSGDVVANAADIDSLSGTILSNSNNISQTTANLNTTGSILHRDIHAISGDLSTDVSSISGRIAANEVDIDALSGSLNTTNSNLVTTGQNLQSQIASNDGDISTLTSNLASSGLNLETQIRNSGTNLQGDIRDLSGEAVLLTGIQTVFGVKTFSDDINVLGNLGVSGNFTLGNDATDKITTRGDLFVDDDASFGDNVTISGDLTVEGGVYPGYPSQNSQAATKLYVDVADNSLSTRLGTSGTNILSEVSDLSGSLNTTGQNLRSDVVGLSGQVVFNTGDQNISGVKSFANNVTVGGDLTVQGTTFTVDTSNVLIEDPILYLGKNQTGTPTVDAGFVAERGSSTNVGFIWDESEDHFATVNTTEIADDNNITIASYADFKAKDIAATNLNTTNLTSTNGALTWSRNSSSTAATITQAGSGDILNLIDGSTEVLTVIDGGSVGIGAASPGAKLEVAGSVRLSDSSALEWVGNSNSINGSSSSNYLAFKTNNSERLRIIADGNIGLGTNSPSANLHISKDAPELRLQGTGSSGTKTNKITFYNTGGGLRTEIKQDYYGGSSDLKISNYDGDILLDPSTSRVGLGTTNPIANFHVAGGSSPIIRIEDSTNNAKLDLQAQDSLVLVGSASNHSLSITTDSTERVRVTNTGNVGIGTTAPSVKLHIVSTDAIKVPVGTTAQRPTAADGMIRYNSTLSKYEGYRSSSWQELGGGGAIDQDEDTYVSTEKTSDDDTLFFYTSGIERAKINSDGSTHIKGDLFVSGAASGINPTQNGHFTTKSYVDSADSELAADIDILSGIVVDNYEDSDSLSGSIDTLTTNLVSTGVIVRALSGVVDDNAADINSLSGSIDTLTTNLVSTGVIVRTLSGVVDDNAADINSLSGSIDTLTTNLVSTGVIVRTLSGVVDDNAADVDSLSGSISSLQSDVNDLSGDAVLLAGDQTIAGVKTFSNNAIFNGDLTVNGTTMTVDTSNVLVEDPVLLLAKNQTGSASLDAGFIAERGDDTNVGFIWDESDDHFAVINTTEAAADSDITIASYANFKANLGVFSSNVTSLGSVGIGTNSPATNLHIRKIDLADDSRNALLLLDGKFTAGSINSGDEIGIAFNVENSGGGSQQTTSITSSYQASYNSLNLQPNGGNVGIGTNNPGYKLDVNGTAHITTAQDSVAPLTLKSTYNGSTAGPLLDLYRKSGTPGDGDNLGTITFTADTNVGSINEFARIESAALDVTDTTEDGALKLAVVTAGTLRSRIYMDSTETVFNDASQDFDFRVESDNSANALFVQGSDGKVGIGTSAPSNTLDINGGLEVNGESYIRSTSNAGLRIQTTDQGITDSDGLRLGLNGTHAFLWVYENKPLALATNGAERATILGNGNFGIGTTSPDSNLDIEGAGSPELRITDTTNTVGAYIQSNDTKTIFGSRTNHPVQIEQNAGAAIYIDTSKNVGIGTNAPSEMLHINKSSGTGSFIRFQDTGGGGVYIGARSNVMELYAGGAERMRIASDGNVGVGTNAPATKLHVEDSTANTTATKIRVQGGSRGFTLGKAQTADNYAHLRPITDTANALRVMPNGTTTRESYVEVWNKDYETGANSTSWHRGMFYIDTSNDVYLRADGYGTAGSVFIGTENNTQTLTVKDSGSVGIGTNAPDGLLHVKNTTYIDVTTNTGTASALIWRRLDKTIVGRIVADTTNLKTQIWDNNSAVVTIGSDQVGIGTDAPWEKLTVFGGGINFGSSPTVNNSGKLTYNSTSGQLKISAHSTGGNTYQTFTVSNGGSQIDAVTILNDGKVGIGTNAPAKLLDVNGTVYLRDDVFFGNTVLNIASGFSNQTGMGFDKSAGQLQVAADETTALELGRHSSAGTVLSVRYESTQVATIESSGQILSASGAVTAPSFSFTNDPNTGMSRPTTDALNFVTNSSERVRITANGSVGIGTDNPVTLLDVRGAVTVGVDDTGHDVRLYGATSGRYWEWDESMDLVRMRDNVKTVWGNGDDLQIYHDGSNSYIKDNGTGSLLIEVAGTGDSGFYKVGGEKLATFEPDGPVSLYHNNSKKLETTSGGVTITGLLTATTKSFTIDHPTKPGKKLRYGSLEGPENGVYIRGKSNNNSIELPEYWTKLVDKDSITVQLTAIGKPQQLYVERIENNVVYIQSEENRKNINQLNYYYLINAERIDVDKLQVEIEE